MKHEILKYLYEAFAKLEKNYGFQRSNEFNDEQSYSVEYSSDIFVIKLEKYRREFYSILFKTGHPDDAINLFNLLTFLDAGSDPSTFNYFVEEKDLEENYYKQFKEISDIVDNNFVQINDFFKSKNYRSKLREIDKFMQNRNPNLFKKI